MGVFLLRLLIHTLNLVHMDPVSKNYGKSFIHCASISPSIDSVMETWVPGTVLLRTWVTQMNTTDIAHDLKKYKIPRKKHRVKFIVTLSLVKNFFLIFIYLFLAVLDLCCRAWASHRDGFSCCRAQAQMPCGMWDLPRTGAEPVFPALAGILNHWTTRKVPS